MGRYSNSVLMIIGAVFAVGVLSGCASKDEKLKQTADLQSQVQSANEVSAQKKYLDDKASLMEVDLERRQRFYQAFVGTFEGIIQVGGADYGIRLTVVPSLPRYVPSGRIRTPEEVAADLENLYLNVQVVQWNPQNTLGSVGCLVQMIRPDIVRGRIDIVSSSCPNLYTIRPSRDATAGRVTPGEASEIASAITSGRMESVSQIFGKMQPTSNANVYTFSANRVQE